MCTSQEHQITFCPFTEATSAYFVFTSQLFISFTIFDSLRTFQELALSCFHEVGYENFYCILFAMLSMFITDLAAFLQILLLTLEIFLSITNILWIAIVIAGFYEFL